MASEKIRIGRHVVELTNPEKVMFPRAGFTKRDLAHYYREVADAMLPHLRGRPISLERYPEGVRKKGFFHKDAASYFPDWVKRVSVKKEKGRVSHVVCENTATLVYLAQMACITPHVWLSRKGNLRRPDRMVFDLDPPGKGFDAVRGAARALRQVLLEIGLVPYLMTTGSRGAHVVVPVARGFTFDTVRDFARDVARVIARRYPKRYTTEARKEKRRGRLYLDTMRNAYGQTAVAPYAVRARAGAPVAAPLDWDELRDPKLDSRRYNIRNILRRLGQKDDPAADIGRHGRGLEAPRKRLDAMLAEMKD